MEVFSQGWAQLDDNLIIVGLELLLTFSNDYRMNLVAP